MDANLSKVKEGFRAQGSLAAFATAYALSVLWTRTILPREFKPNPQYSEWVCLTPFGQDVVAALDREQPGLDQADTCLAVFCIFGHQELAVDLDRTDIDAITAELSRCLIDRELRYPYIFGRELYDRAVRLFGPVGRHIGEEETQQLLSGTSQGVFQVGEFTTGPLGLLSSSTIRDLKPRQTAGLTMCPDPACQRVHETHFSTGHSDAARTYSSMSRVLHRDFGEPTDWDALWRGVSGVGEEWHRDFNANALLWLLGNALAIRELRAVAASVIEDSPATLRPLLPKATAEGVRLKGTPHDITEPLDGPALLQLLLLAPDDTIVRCIDRCIDEGTIRIPPSEVRRPVQDLGTVHRVGGFLNQLPECSSLGVRFVPSRRDVATSRLRRLVWLTAGDDEATREHRLAWLLADMPGSTVPERVRDLVARASPSEVVRDYALRGPAEFQATTDYLRYGAYPDALQPGAKGLLEKRIIWKLGFDVPLYPEAYARFDKQLDDFREVVETYSPVTVEGQEAIRAIGVNVFVSLEEFLDACVSYTAWALLTDHYSHHRRERYKYNLHTARRFASAQLDGHPIGDDRTISYSTEGRNQLFDLVESLRVLASILEDAVTSKAQPEWARHESDFPEYVGTSTVRVMPFKHKLPVMDLDADAAAGIIALLRDVYKELLGASVMAVRNRVPHTGGEFPGREALRAAVTGMERMKSRLLDAGCAPALHLFQEGRTDSYRRRSYVLADYRGKQITMQGDTGLEGLGLPSPMDPQLILHSATIAGEGLPLRFFLVESSEYTDMWAGYPSVQRPAAKSGTTYGEEAPGGADEVPERGGPYVRFYF